MPNQNPAGGTCRRDHGEIATIIHRDAPHLARFLAEVRDERAAQIAKWGDQRHPDGTHPDFVWVFTGPASYVVECVRDNTQFRAEDGNLTWRDILLEEVAEAFEQAYPATLRAELVQIAAVCGAWISDIDRRAAAQIPGQQEIPAHRPVVFADEDDAVHFAPNDRAECGGSGGRRAACLASVTCRDCLDAFHAAEAPRGFRVGDLARITGREGESDATPPGLRLNGKTGVVVELDKDPAYPIGLRVEGWLDLVWCATGELQRLDDASAPAEGEAAR